MGPIIKSLIDTGSMKIERGSSLALVRELRALVQDRDLAWAEVAALRAREYAASLRVIPACPCGRA